MKIEQASVQKKEEEEFAVLNKNEETADADDSDLGKETLPEKETIPDPYIDKSVAIRNGMYGKWLHNKKADECIFDYIGAAIYLNKTIIFAETMNRELELYFYDPQGQKVTFSLPREKMTEQFISEFTRKGIQVQKKNMGILLTSIFNQEKFATVEIRHEKLGFSTYKSHKVFFGAKGIGVNSVYAGKLAVAPTGSFDVWKRMIVEEVVNTDMEIILAIAAAAPLIDFLKPANKKSRLN